MAQIPIIKPKVDLPSSIERESTWSSMRTIHIHIERGLQQAARALELSPWWVVERRPTTVAIFFLQPKIKAGRWHHADDLKPPKEASPLAIWEGPICYRCQWSEATQRGSTVRHERKRVESVTERNDRKNKRKRRERSEFEVRGREKRD